MPRHAVGDLLVDLEVPTGLEWIYDDDGVLSGADPSRRWLVEIGGLTIAAKDPAVTDAGLRSVLAGAKEAGATVHRPSPELAWFKHPGPERSGDGRHCEHWTIGLGARHVLVTLSHDAEDGPELEALRAQVEAALPTLRGLVPPHRVVGEQRLFFELSPSHDLWFETRRADLAAMVKAVLPDRVTDGLPPAEVLDDLWEDFLASEPDDEEASQVINVLGVALGDHLARARSFGWVILSDAWGTGLAVVALQGTANVVTDPFNFVAKRWDRKEPRFLAHGLRAICQRFDQVKADWGAPPRSDA